ncbi:MAG TPA: M20/M25/M40 family metallo-hydrolase [Gemmatimonadales bacterium]|nr:M20/M25/M40 family metallo-hydrolase [Gemmatimonadales bacterium]
MNTLRTLAPLAGLALAVSALPAQTAPATHSREAAAILTDIRYLASDSEDGRLTGSPQNDAAAAYLARRFRSLGLRPGGDSGTFLQHWTVNPTSATREAAVAGKATENVVAVLPGADRRLASQAVVIGAHFDHLGNGPFGSAAHGDSVHLIHHGADDNASGTAGVLEIARLLAGKRPRPARTVVFVLFSGEEEGALGSAWYADHPVISMDSTLAMLNLDMVGRMRDNRLLVLGVLSAREWQGLLDSVDAPYHLDVHASGTGWGPSDQNSFYAKQRPVLHFFTDLHADYHTPADTWDRINADGIETVARLVADVARRLAARAGSLTFVNAPPPVMASGQRAYLGTIPDMTSEPGGVKLTGVTAGSPADSAGIRAGDVITAIAGDTVASLTDFQNALVKHHPGDTVAIKVRRGDQTASLTAVLGRR